MRRRSVLASVGVFLLAGCTSSGDGSGTTTTSGAGTTSTSGGSPTVAESSLRVSSAECGSQGTGKASISFGSGAVSVAGTVVGNNACYRAQLADVSYDAASDACRVVVEAFNASPEKMCAQCITVIDYEATVEFDGGLPGTVEVVHDDLIGRSTVATKSR